MAQTKYKTDCIQCGGRGFFVPKKEFRGAMLPDWANPQNCPRCDGCGDEPAKPKKRIMENIESLTEGGQ